MNTRNIVIALMVVAVIAIVIAIAIMLTRAPAPTPAPVVQTPTHLYSNSVIGFYLKLPDDYTVDESYVYQELGPEKDISGVKFTIPSSLASSTNLGSDSYISVEEIPKATACTADRFMWQGTPVRTITDANATYSVASTLGAGAGNRYEETVYALPVISASRQTCIAVRYFIHYGVIDNYPPGTVREFDKPALLAAFGAIRRSLVVQ